MRSCKVTGSYYFWKWADNDLPGPPAEVHAALLRGEMHPALQPFDARPLLKVLEDAATQGQKRGEEWDWECTPLNKPEQASFVFVTGPKIGKFNAAYQELIEQLVPLGVSGYDEGRALAIEFLLPKLNAMELGQYPDREWYDIHPNDLPSLLRRIDHHDNDGTAMLTNRLGHFVHCCAYQRRFTVEWRENHDLKDVKNFDQWRVKYPVDIEAQRGKRFRRRFIPAGEESARWIDGEWRPETAGEKEHELLLFADTLRIFEAFLRGELRSTKYSWENINHLVK